MPSDMFTTFTEQKKDPKVAVKTQKILYLDRDGYLVLIDKSGKKQRFAPIPEDQG